MELSEVVLFPRAPLPPFPQARTVPSELRATENPRPAEIAVTPDPLPRPDTWTGLSLCVVVPSPSWPFPLGPQASTVPSDLTARAWPPPEGPSAKIATAPDP